MPAAAAILRLIAKHTPASCAAVRLDLQGLELELTAVDPALLAWVSSYFEPSGSEQPRRVQRQYRVAYLQSDALLAAIFERVTDFDLVRVHRYGADSYMRRVRLAKNVVMYFDADEGNLWLSDKRNNALLVLGSSRTRYPALLLGRAVAEVRTRYLAEQGWTLFHAGAVQGPAGSLMVMGYAGAGKTTLLLALMSCGWTFIGNEMCYGRRSAAGIEVLNYPQPVAIGIGTALQLPPLKQLVLSHEHLQYPRLRFKARHLAQTPPSEWHLLPDKLQPLPRELCTLLQCPMLPGAVLSGLVMPAVDPGRPQAVASRMSKLQVKKLIRGNHISLDEGEHGHPPWLELNFGAANVTDVEGLIDRLSALKAHKLKFGIAIDDVGSAQACATAIQAAFPPAFTAGGPSAVTADAGSTR